MTKSLHFCECGQVKRWVFYTDKKGRIRRFPICDTCRVKGAR